jgi:hypothetical protein
LHRYATVLRALRAATAATAAIAAAAAAAAATAADGAADGADGAATATGAEEGHLHALAQQSLAPAAAAAAGALLDTALSAGVAVPRADASAVVSTLSALLLGRKAHNLSHVSSATQAAAALGLAGAVGGSWCLASVSTTNASAFGTAGLNGLGGGRGRAAGVAGEVGVTTSTTTKSSAAVSAAGAAVGAGAGAGAVLLSTPLLWGGEEGAAEARAALKTLEAVASAEGTSAAGSTGDAVALRAREAGAWGLALAADRAIARAAASASTSAASSGGGGGGRPDGSGGGGGGSIPGALGVLVNAVLGEIHTDASSAAASAAASAPLLASARALRILSQLDRLPAGDWPGSLRRLTRVASAFTHQSTQPERRRRRVANELRAACVQLAVAHPGPAVGGGLLESILGAGGGGDDDGCDVDVAGWSGGDVSGGGGGGGGSGGGGGGAAHNLPPAAVLRALAGCVAALPRAAAAAALRRVVASAAAATAQLPASTAGTYHLLTIVHVFKPHLSCCYLFLTTTLIAA